MDSSPLKSTLGTATRFAGGVDKDKVMDLFQDQQFDEAINYLSPVLKADSDNMPVLTYAGYAYYMEDNEAAATACYRRLIGVDSNSVTGLHYLVLLLQNSSTNEALTYASRLLALQPVKAVWWRTVGELWRRQQKPDSALAYLRRAYTLAPADLKTISDLGSVLIDGRAYDEADSLLDTGLALDSMNISLLKLRVKGRTGAKIITRRWRRGNGCFGCRNRRSTPWNGSRFPTTISNNIPIVSACARGCKNSDWTSKPFIIMSRGRRLS